MEEAVRAGHKIGVIAANEPTLRDSEYYLHRTAKELGRDVETELYLAEELMPLHRTRAKPPSTTGWKSW